MEGTDYAFWSVDLCAAGVGAPHIRQRLFFTGEKICRYCGNTGWFYAERELGPCSCKFGLGDAERPRLERHTGHGDGSTGRTIEGGPTTATGSDGGLADPNGGNPGAEWQQSCGEYGQQQANSGVCWWPCGTERDREVESHQLADDQIGGRIGGTRLCDRQTTGLRGEVTSNGCAILSEPGRPGPVNSRWANVDWLFCRDGKWRPVESGTFPLVDGATFRVDSGSPYAGKSRGKLIEGAGNAIVSEAAAHVIAAYLEYEADALGAVHVERSDLTLIEDLL